MAEWDDTEIPRKVRMPGGLRAPWTRTLRVDQGARGDFATIADAIAHAQNAGANSSDQQWLIMVGPGRYSESIVIPDGVTVFGSGWRCTRIIGQVTVQTGGALLAMMAATSTAGHMHVLTFDRTAGANPPVVRGCFLYLIPTTSSAGQEFTTVRQQGAGSPNVAAMMEDCYVYGNLTAGSGSGRTMTLMSVEADSTLPIEAQRCHYKHSVASGVTPRLARCKGQGVQAYVQATGDWICVGNTIVPVALLNENNEGPGGYTDVTLLGRTEIPVRINAGTWAGDTWLQLPNQEFHRIASKDLTLNGLPVTIDANDSAGAGFRRLRVPNA